MGRNRRRRTEPKPEPAPQTDKSQPQATARAALAGFVTALFVVRPLFPSESAATHGDGLPVVMLWLVALMTWGVLVARGAVTKVRFGWPDLAMAALVLWYTVAALWAVAYESPRPAINMLWEWLGLAVAFCLARQVFTTGLQRRAAGSVMVAVAVIVSIHGLYQYAVELPATRDAYAHASEDELHAQGVWFPPGSPERQVFEQRLESLEPMATFALTNSLAGFLIPWGTVVLGLSVAFSRQLTAGQRLATAALLVPIGICLLLTKSRSAFLAYAAGTVAIAAVWWFQRKPARPGRVLLVIATAAALLVISVAGAVAVGGLDVEVVTEAPKSLGYRLEYWKASAEMIGEAPLLGCGPGNFQDRYPQYKLPAASEEISDPHNFALEIWATAGTPAFLAMLAMGVASCLCFLRPPHRSSNQSAEPQGTADVDKTELNAILIGAGAGVLLSLPVSMMSVAPPAWYVPVLGFPVGALALLVLRCWILNGAESAALWAVAAFVLLVHLLFSGGISFPGVSAGLWLLTALALNAVRCGVHQIGPRVGLSCFGATLVLAAACYWTGYQPTLTARTLTERAATSPDNQVALLQQAAKADPWAVEPRKNLADVFLQRWLAQPSPETMANFDLAVEDTLALAPRSASLHHYFGEAYCQCYAMTHDPELLTEGIRLFEAAVSRYPNNCRMRADLAEAYLLKSDQIGFERERAEALRLDELTPHLDKKLPSEQRQRLRRTTPAPNPRPHNSE